MSHQIRIFITYVKAHYSIGLLIVLFTFKSSLYIKEISTLSPVCHMPLSICLWYFLSLRNVNSYAVKFVNLQKLIIS